jgi:hypothetical protein
MYRYDFVAIYQQIHQMDAHLIIAYNKRGEDEIGLHLNYRLLEFKKGIATAVPFLV